MIKNIFLPERRGTYYLFNTRLIGIEINNTEIHLAQIKARGTQRIVEKLITVPFTADIQVEWSVRAIDALKTAMLNLPTPDEIIAVLPSTQVIFKRLQVPFTDPEKIHQIIGFEVEPLLPFPLHEAVVDCVITHTSKTEKSSELLIVATQKERIEKLVSICTQAHVPLTGITVDLFSLYNLIVRLGLGADTNSCIVLATTSAQTTGLACIAHGTITLVRSLGKGTLSIAKQISTLHATSAETALEELLRFGIEKNENTTLHDNIQKAISHYLADIAFTCATFAAEVAPIQKIIFSGPVTTIPGFIAYATEQLKIPCQLLDVSTLAHDPHIRFASGITPTTADTIALGTTLPIQQLMDFNLLQQTESPGDLRLFIKQAIIAAILLLSFFGMLIVHFYMQRRALKKVAMHAEQETITALKKQFPSLTAKNIGNIVEDAQEEVDKEETTWFAFSSAARASLLKILLELKSKIDVEALGFVIKKLTITEGQLIIYARVRDYPALKLLEKTLRTSPLFETVEQQANPDFETNGMKITLTSPNKEEA